MPGQPGTHQSHCCIIHGCKYSDEECPVVSGELKQEHPCEDCDNDAGDERQGRVNQQKKLDDRYLAKRRELLKDAKAHISDQQDSRILLAMDYLNNGHFVEAERQLNEVAHLSHYAAASPSWKGIHNLTHIITTLLSRYIVVTKDEKRTPFALVAIERAKEYDPNKEDDLRPEYDLSTLKRVPEEKIPQRHRKRPRMDCQDEYPQPSPTQQLQKSLIDRQVEDMMAWDREQERRAMDIAFPRKEPEANTTGEPWTGVG